MNETVAFRAVDTALGRLLLAATEVGVVSVAFHDTGDERARIAEHVGLPGVADPARTGPPAAWLAAYVSGARPGPVAPIDWRLTSPLQHRVLQALLDKVPYGQAVTYGELAILSGTGVPARAVGQIMGANPIPLIVPCHRVVAANGLGGYSGGSGIDVKRWLLTLEGVLHPMLDWDPDQGPRMPGTT